MGYTSFGYKIENGYVVVDEEAAENWGNEGFFGETDKCPTGIRWAVSAEVAGENRGVWGEDNDGI